jgi:MFS family permease
MDKYKQYNSVETESTPGSVEAGSSETKREIEPTPIPTTQIFSALSCTWSHGYYLNAIPSFFPLWLLIWFDAAEVGYYVSLMLTMSNIGQVFAYPAWGYAAERIGRRTCLIIGIFLSLTALNLMGFANSYTEACVAVVMIGCVVCTEVCVKTIIGELTDSSNRYKGFSYLGLILGAAHIVAPIVTGLIYDPAKVLGGMYDTAFWAAHPMLLPLMICMLFDLVALTCVVFILKETLRTPMKSDLASEAAPIISSPPDVGMQDLSTPGVSDPQPPVLPGDPPMFERCCCCLDARVRHPTIVLLIGLFCCSSVVASCFNLLFVLFVELTLGMYV